jgi:hypothetical protein
MDRHEGIDQPDKQGNDTNHGRASFGTGSTTQGGSNFGQGSHDTGGSPYRQGSVQSEGANYDNEADRIGDSTTGTRAEGSQSPYASAPDGADNTAQQSSTSTDAENMTPVHSRVNLAEDDIEDDNEEERTEGIK